MEVLVRNAEGNLSEKDRDYAAAKLGRLNRYFNQAHKVEMVHREDRQHKHHLEITVFADHFTIRGEETDDSVRAAIDLVAEKLENRLTRLKGRLIRNHRRKGTPAPPDLAHETPDETEDLRLRERKTFLLKHMSIEEAALQMEMIDLPFFVFRNEDNGNIEVLYRLKNGDFGLMQPEG
jgi:putative sigma-54 modulation protein